MNADSRKSLWTGIAIGVLISVGLLLLLWSVQTAWLGSFPGRDVEQYRSWFYMELLSAVVCMVVAITLFISRWRKLRD